MKNQKDSFEKEKKTRFRSLSETSAIQSTICRPTTKYANRSITAKNLQTASAGYPRQGPKEMKLNHTQYRIAYIVKQLLAFCCQ